MKKPNRIDVQIEKNGLIDNGEGVISFQGGLTLSDESQQLNGTRYDIASMDISRFDGQVFADHDYSITAIVGKAFGVAKQGTKLVAEGVRFAVKESSLARFTYEMVRSGFINAVSIGTFGDLDGEGVYHNAVLKEFSFVGLGNNESATINSIAQNTIEHAEEEGLDTQELRDFLKQNKVKIEDPEEEIEEPIINKPSMTRLEELRLKKNNGTATAEETTELEGLETAEEQKQKEAQEAQNAAIASAITSGIEAAMKPMQEKMEAIEKNNFNKSAVEPEFKPAGSGAAKVTKSKFETMEPNELTQLQVSSYHKMTKQGDHEAGVLLREINEFHKNQLIEQGLIKKNVITMDTFGNFVTNPELLTEIQGYRTDFSQLLTVFPYRNTTSLSMAFLTRDGDINMQPVEMCDDGEDGNLKPVSEYDATPTTKTLEELAAVTPVCTAATIFLAVDLLADAGQGYRNSYDRNKARGIIAALEKAAEDNDTASFAESGDLDDAEGALLWIQDVRKAVFAISQGEGVLVMNEATFGIVWNALVIAGAGGALTDTVASGEPMKALWGKRIVVVPNELMPTLGDTGTYRTYEYEGANVTINHAIFYVNPSNVRARENGGLRYDLSTDAAYEVNGTVYSAFQRNEIVLRGSHFRGTAVLDPTRVGAVRAGAVIS